MAGNTVDVKASFDVTRPPSPHMKSALPNEVASSKVEIIVSPKTEDEADEALISHLEHLRLKYGSTFPPSSPLNPYFFPTRTKLLIGAIFSFGQLIPIMSASMIAPSLSHIATDLRISSPVAQITMSSYFLGMAFAPLVIGSLSEMYGRKKVWVACNAWYVAWNALCPVGGVGGMIVGRVMAGAGACVGVTLNGPVMADMYGKKDRGKSLAIITLLPYLGPALGPLLGGLVTQLVHWKWVFWIMSVVDSFILILGLIIVRETYTPVLLRRKAAKEGTSVPPQPSHMKTSLLRPIHILIHRPIIWLVSLMSTLAFGVYCLVLSSYASLWVDKYRQTELISSLHYISIAFGSTIAGQIGSRFMDYVYRTMSQRNNDDGIPEYRIPYLMIGILLMPIGFFWYGWAAEHRLTWIMVDVGTVVFTLGSFVASQAVMAYQLDEFAEFSASASAASRVVSYVLAFVLPIFAPVLYERVGYGWGNSILAFSAVAIGLPGCWILWSRGAKLRTLGRET